jgi:repressor LexA
MQILRFVRDFRSRHGYSPTMQEIGDQVNLSKVTVFEHIRALERKGILVRGQKHCARSLQVSSDFRFPEEQPVAPSGGVPLVGQISAGLPIEAVEDRQSLDWAELFPIDEETFALQVRGDSMIDEQIRDGDYVLCRRTRTPRDGQTVVALVEGSEATLKKFYREAGRIRLQPANPAYKPIYTDEVEIQGVVIGVIRRV